MKTALRKSMFLALLIIILITAYVIVRTLTFAVDVDNGTLLPKPIKVQQLPSDQNEPVLLDKLTRAIQIKTISSLPDTQIKADAFSQFTSFLKTEFPVVFSTLDVQFFNEHSLLIKWVGINPSLKPALFLAHSDVVPIQDNEKSKWKHPPFSGAIAEDYIWGRGTLDDKASLLAQLEAIESLLKSNFKPQRSLYFAFGHDEEVGGELGAITMANHFADNKISFEFLVDEGMVITDGIVPHITNRIAHIGPGEKGYLSLKLVVESQGGHSSKPPELTASGRIARAIYRIQSEPFDIDLTYSAEFVRHLGTKMPFTQRMIMANQWLFKPIADTLIPPIPELLASLRTTTAPTMLSGSNKDNVLATEASAIINFRILPSDSIDFVIQETRRKIKDEQVRIEIYGKPSEPSKISDTDSSGYKIIKQSIKEGIPNEAITVAPMLVIAATDARHYSHLTDQSYRFSPITITKENKDGFHGINERISQKSYLEAIRIYQRLFINSGSLIH